MKEKLVRRSGIDKNDAVTLSKPVVSLPKDRRVSFRRKPESMKAGTEELLKYCQTFEDYALRIICEHLLQLNLYHLLSRRDCDLYEGFFPGLVFDEKSHPYRAGERKFIPTLVRCRQIQL